MNFNPHPWLDFHLYGTVKTTSIQIVQTEINAWSRSETRGFHPVEAAESAYCHLLRVQCLDECREMKGLQSSWESGLATIIAGRIDDPASPWCALAKLFGSDCASWIVNIWAGYRVKRFEVGHCPQAGNFCHQKVCVCVCEREEGSKIVFLCPARSCLMAKVNLHKKPLQREKKIELERLKGVWAYFLHYVMCRWQCTKCTQILEQETTAHSHTKTVMLLCKY